jgi:hypothetical protein
MMVMRYTFPRPHGLRWRECSFSRLNDGIFNRASQPRRYDPQSLEIMMFERAVGRAKCLIGMHRRSRGRTVYEGSGADTSVCRYCGVSMKSAPGGWVVTKR